MQTKKFYKSINCYNFSVSIGVNINMSLIRNVLNNGHCGKICPKVGIQ